MALRQSWLAWTLVCVQGLAGAQPPAPPAPVPLADVIEDRAADALWWGDWDELERLHAQARLDTRRAQEGEFAVCLFARGVGRKRNGGSQAYFEAVVAGTAEWARRRPELPLAHSLHAEAIVNLAWFYRGGGYAKTVSDQRFEDFHGKLNEALDYTKAHLAVMEQDSFYSRPLLAMLGGLSVSVDRQLELARKALHKEPGDECVHYRVVYGLVPKWGARPEQLESWVRESMKGLPEAAALARYARLYDSAAESDYEQSLFDSSLARWPLMRDGLRQILVESPNSRHWKNRLAYFACMVKDRETAVPALEAVEAEPRFKDWGSDGQRTYQSCKRWALQS